MHILIAATRLQIPAFLYGGTERVIWDLGKELTKMGHKVSYLCAAGSTCDFANMHIYNPAQPLNQQIPPGVDVVHFNTEKLEEISKPYIVTNHFLVTNQNEQDINTVFVSRKHAQLSGSEQFVYNGLDWDNYGSPDLNNKRDYFHFLGNAAWRIKNFKGAKKVVLAVPGEKLAVLGGNRIEWSRRFKITLSPRVQFYGMVGGAQKNALINGSKGLIHPIKAPESFGLALTESLYFGCPVFGTPYGSLPEIVGKDFGFLSAKQAELSEAIKNAGAYSRQKCHEYARDNFNSKLMAQRYLEKYQTVLSGKQINPAPPRLEQKYKGFLPWE